MLSPNVLIQVVSNTCTKSQKSPIITILASSFFNHQPLPKLPSSRAQRGYHYSYHPQWRRLHPNDPGSNPWESTTVFCLQLALSKGVVHRLRSLPSESKCKSAYLHNTIIAKLLHTKNGKICLNAYLHISRYCFLI